MPRTKHFWRRVRLALSGRGLFVVGVTTSTALVVVASTLVWLIRIHDADDYPAAVGAVVTVQRVETAWNVELARVRNGRAAHFDTLAEFARQSVELRAALLAAIRGIPGLPRRLLETAQELVDALAAKTDHTDRFKRHYAVLRNATRYLPSATSALAKDPNIDAGLLRDILTAKAALDQYVASPASAATGEVGAALGDFLGDLKMRSATLTRSTANSIATFTSHASVRAEHAASMRRAYVQATSGDVADLAASLVRDLRTAASVQEHRVAFHRNALLAVGLALMFLWSVLAWLRFRRANARYVIEPIADSVASDSSAVSLVAHRIQTETVARRLAERARAISECVDAMTVVRHYARSEATRKAQAVAEIRSHAKETRNAAERLAAFAKDGEDAPSTYSRFGIGDCIERAVYATNAKSVAAVTVDLSGARPLFASRTEICVVLQSAVENAVHAIQDANRRGAIAISTDRTHEGIVVSVIHNGVGTARDTHDSTSAGRGGLGLDIGRYLVAKYHGSLSISTRPEEGTTIRITLPIVDHDSVKGQASDPGSNPIRSTDGESPE